MCSPAGRLVGLGGSVENRLMVTLEWGESLAGYLLGSCGIPKVLQFACCC